MNLNPIDPAHYSLILNPLNQVVELRLCLKTRQKNFGLLPFWQFWD
jgi:hypothetical protein